jgi:hypothetical protein
MPIKARPLSVVDAGSGQMGQPPEAEKDDQQQPIQTRSIRDDRAFQIPATAFEILEGRFNGLFTNDKFCLSRFGQLSLTWWRYPLRLRGRHSDLQTASLGEVAHQGGSHETAVAHSPADVRPSRRAATLGPRIAGDPGVGGHW